MRYQGDEHCEELFLTWFAGLHNGHAMLADAAAKIGVFIGASIIFSLMYQTFGKDKTGRVRVYVEGDELRVDTPE